MKSTGYFKYASLATAKTLAVACGGSLPTGTNFVRIIPATQAIRYRQDGINPTATDGMPVAVGEKFESFLPQKLILIEQAASATVHIETFKL